MKQLKLSSKLKTIKRVCKKDIIIDDSSVDEIYELIKYSKTCEFLIRTHNISTASKLLEYAKLLKSFGTALTKDKFIFVYGKEEGIKKWNSYCEKQATSNTFEYKNKKYGWSKEQFDSYNKSRSVTLENLISRHGKNSGNKKWEKYCKRQSYTKSLEYDGPERHAEISAKKAHTYDNYLKRYKDPVIAEQKLKDFYSNAFIGAHKGLSKQSKFVYEEIEKLLNKKENRHVYHGFKNKEYVVYDKTNKKCRLYDFVCTRLNMVIEYHGDHYHGNPNLYKPNDNLKGRGMSKTLASDKWKDDIEKQNLIENERGYKMYVIWESDWKNNKQEIIKKLKEYINEHRRNRRV